MVKNVLTPLPPPNRRLFAHPWTQIIMREMGGGKVQAKCENGVRWGVGGGGGGGCLKKAHHRVSYFGKPLKG